MPRQTRLIGYFDAAGHPDGQHALTVGGYIASVNQWARFDRDWRRALARHGIDTFHMAEFESCQGEFKTWQGRERERTALLLKLVRICKEHVRHSFATMMLLDAWRDINQTYALKEHHCTPFGVCGFFTIDKAMRWLLRRESDAQVKFVFEDGDKHKGDFIWMMEQFWRINPRNLRGAAPVFVSKTESPVQAADLLIWELQRLAKDRLQFPDTPPPARQTYRELMTIPSTWGVVDREKLEEFCVAQKVPKRGEPHQVWSPFASPPRVVAD